MLQELRDIQIKDGAIFTEEWATPSSFSNDLEALKAVQEGVALCDSSHWGLLKLTGEDRGRFLHNQTTNHIGKLKLGEGCNTVFVTSTGRTIDLVTVYVTEDEILILTSPQRRQKLMEWMDRYIFPMDRVELKDISDENAIFTLIGPGSNYLLQQLRLESLIGQPETSHLLEEIDNYLMRVAVGSGLTLPGYTFIIPTAAAPQIWSKLRKLGAIPFGNHLWEQLRIQQGRPLPDRELTEDYNPLEAGLWQAISFDKGCYIGQETIARLNTYKGVKQRLWGVQLDRAVEPETTVLVEGEKVGILTSYTAIAGQPFGLAYVRTKAGGEGLKVQIGEASGELISVPFLIHEYYSH
jgi:folate-binding protein YgfZ